MTMLVAPMIDIALFNVWHIKSVTLIKHTSQKSFKEIDISVSCIQTIVKQLKLPTRCEYALRIWLSLYAYILAPMSAMQL